jgi:hypothetical protein
MRNFAIFAAFLVVVAACKEGPVNAAGGAWLFVRGQTPFYKNFRGDQDQLPSLVTGIQYQVR